MTIANNFDEFVEKVSEAERKALIANNASIQQDNLIQQTQRFTVKSKDGKVYSGESGHYGLFCGEPGNRLLRV